MKKIILLISFLLIIVGCSKNNEKEIMNKFVNSVDNSKGYQLNGKLTITRGDAKYTYDIDSSYKRKDLFRVSLKNTTNKHEQIILKNEEGVYVKTHQSTKHIEKIFKI